MYIWENTFAPLPPLLEYAPSGFEQNTLPLKTAIFGKTSAPPPYT